jgi:2-polyprenyl-3-methyl-5-hydroxy-6-metoxy-1,4-benzoquinol methylase
MNEHLNITIMDLAPTIEYAKRDKELSSNTAIKFEVGDARRLDKVAEYDVIMINDLLHSFGRDDKRNIIVNASRALKENGVLCISKFSLSDRYTRGDENSYTFSLKMFLKSEEGYLAKDSEIVHMLVECGLRISEVTYLESGLPAVAIVATNG